MPYHDKYKPIFKSGQIVYFNGGIEHELKTDTPYRVVYCVPKNQHTMDVHLKGPGIDDKKYQYGIPFFSEYLMSIEEYNKLKDIPKKERKLEKKFKEGEKVFFIGDDYKNLNNHTTYTIEFCGLNYLILRGFKDMFDVKYFISKEERDKKNSNADKINKKLNNFKEGDVVYYNAIERNFEYHKPYKLWGYASEKSTVFGIYVGNVLKPIPKDVVNKDFISEEEYKKKYGAEDPKIIGNYKDFTTGKAFKKDDKIYYMGDSIQKLKADIPYKVDYYNPLTGFIKIGEDVFPDADFISEEKYKELNDDKISTIEIGKVKSEIQLKLQIYKDTKSNKLIWASPYSNNEEWYRTKIKLNNPPDAYLRIDIKKVKGEWEMFIYFHRNNHHALVKNSGVVVRYFKETSTLKALARRIKNQIDKTLDKLLDDLEKQNNTNLN
jgi:hypothetical protein